MFQLEQKGFCFTIEKEELVITAGGFPVVRLNLLPAVDAEPLALGAWQEVDETHVMASVDGLGQVHVGMVYGYPAYWLETDRKHFDHIVYFPDSPFDGKGWQPFSNDEDDRCFDGDLDAATVVSSNYGMFHPDQPSEDWEATTISDGPADYAPAWIWNVPVRAMSMQAESGWLGLSIPGPLPVCFTRFEMERRRFSMPFEIVRPGCDGGQMPRVFFAPGKKAEDVLGVQNELTGKMGYLRPREPDHPSWWTAPYYKPVFELLRLQDGQCIQHDEAGRQISLMTTENLLAWTHKVRESVRANKELTIEFDQMYHPAYGDYTPIPELGGTEGFRKTVDMLREENIYIGLYFHLYYICSESPLCKKHPEIVCKQTDPNYRQRHGVPVGKGELCVLDWTNPTTREVMLNQVRYLISEAPGCLNADWLAVNNNYGVDNRFFAVSDPDWGIGDLMTMKIMKLVYEKVKEIKPYAMVKRQSPADSYMQPYCDRAACAENWMPRSDYWYKRGRIMTRTHPTDVIHSACAYFNTRYKANEYYMGFLAWNVPEINAVEHSIHTRLTYEELREKDYRRRRAGIQCYLNAPANITDRCHVDFHDQHHITAWRKYTHGPLAGFYAALAMSPRCFVTYNAKQATVTASESRTVNIPLPPGATVNAVRAVPHEGPEQDYAYEMLDDSTIQLYVADAAGEIMLYRVVYTL